MSKRLIASVTLAAFSSLAVPVAALPGDTGRAKSMVESTGKVLVQQNGEWVRAEAGSIAQASKVRTGLDGAAVVALEDGSLLRLAPQTQIDMSSSSIALERGRLMASARGELNVHTDATSTSASSGEFVVYTSNAGTKMEVLSGNARMAADGQVLNSVDQDVAAEVFGGDNLNASQYYGDVAMLDDQWKGKWKGKGGGARSDDSDEAAGGTQTTSPDTNVRRPVTRPRQPVQPRTQPQTPPPTNNPPVTNTPPANTPPAANTPTSPPPAAGGGGFPVVPVVLGVAGLAALIIVLSDNGNGDDPVPSPSFP